MPNKFFNSASFKAVEVSEENAPNTSLIYSAPALYFNEDNSVGEIQLQLKTFQESDSYIEFKTQYETLLHVLNQWCKAQSIIVTTQVEEESIPALFLFQKRLLSSKDYYSTRKAELFSEGKRALEEIYLLLQDKTIYLDIKKNILLNLQKGIAVCVDGIVTNIIDARDDLKAAKEGDHFLRTNILRTLIQQFALETLRKVHLNTEHYRANEIHYGAAYTNYVAEAYGLSRNNDKAIESLKLSQDELQQFSQDLDKLITPKAVLGELFRTLKDEMLLMREQFFTTFFKNKKEILFGQSQSLLKAASQLIDQWNEKHRDLLPLDLNVLFQLNDEGTSIIPAAYNEALYKRMVSRNFSTLYLVEGKYERAYRLFSDRKLVISNGLYWIENDKQVMNITPEELLSEDSRYLCGSFLLNELVNLTPERAQELIGQNHAMALAPGPIQLLQRGFYFTLETALSDDFLSGFLKPEQFQTVEFADAMNTYLTTNQRIILIEKLLKRGWLNAEIVRLCWNSMNSINPKKFPAMLNQLLNQKLVTPELFSVFTLLFEGNALCYLARSGELELFNNLIVGNFVTHDALTAKVNEVNAVWFLAKSLQFTMMKKLLEKGVLSNEVLRAAPVGGEFKNVNIVLFLVRARQNTLLEKLVHANMVTEDLFTLDALQLLLKNGNYDFLALLLQNKIVTQEFMATNLKPVVLCWKNISDLIKKEHFVLAELLLDKNSISWRVPAFFQGQHNQSMLSSVDIELLQAKGQGKLLQKLVDKGIAVDCSAMMGSSLVGKECLTFFSEKSVAMPVTSMQYSSAYASF